MICTQARTQNRNHTILKYKKNIDGIENKQLTLTHQQLQDKQSLENQSRAIQFKPSSHLSIKRDSEIKAQTKLKTNRTIPTDTSIAIYINTVFFITDIGYSNICSFWIMLILMRMVKSNDNFCLSFFLYRTMISIV